ncbi:uncharacterized protein LOC143675688 [Tamandua tetradactyla]|uniref:uncharacterized protein LOC143675688 n=1 Tax=Tamandua tetradactyla TaxID=48850 RepID=UPI004053B550
MAWYTTPEPGAHLPGEGESEDNHLPLSPAETEEQRWRQETDLEDFETLSHQSDRGSDTKSDPFKSASDTESLPSDLPAGGASPEREASWVCPDVPATRTLQKKSLPCVPGPGPKEKLDSSPSLKRETYKSEFGVSAAIAGEEKAGHVWDSVASLERVSLLAGVLQHARIHSKGATVSPLPARAVTTQGPGVVSAFSHQKSKSESCLDAPAVWPFLLWRCEVGQSWPQIHPRAKGTGQLPCRDFLHSRAPLGARAENTDLLLPWPYLDVSCRPSCLLYTKLCHSTPENIDDPGRAHLGHQCVHTGALTRAFSIAYIPLGYPAAPSGGNCGEVRTHLKEGTEAEQDPRIQNTLCPPPTHLSPLLPSRTLYVQIPYKPSDSSLETAPSAPTPEDLQLENQLGQDLRTCPGRSCLTSELGNVSPDEGLAPASYKSKQSRGHRPEQLKSLCPAPKAADGNDKQKHLQDISVEAGNRIRNHTSKHALSEQRKLSTEAEFSRRCCSGGTRVWNRALMGCSAVNSPGAPEAILKSKRIDTSKEENAMVLDLNCRKNAGQGVSEVTAVKVSDCSREGGECGAGPSDPPARGGRTLAASPRLQRTAGCAAPGCKSPLIIIAVEQKGLQATRRKVETTPETRACEILEENPGFPCSTGVSPCAFPEVGKPKSCGNECRGPAAPDLGMEERALSVPSEAADPGSVLIPHAASKERAPDKAGFFSGKSCSQERAWSVLSTDKPSAEKLPGKHQNSRARADDQDPVLDAALGPGVSASLPSPEEIPSADGQHPERAQDECLGAAPSPEHRSKAQESPDPAAREHGLRAPREEKYSDDQDESRGGSTGESAAHAPEGETPSPAPGRAQSLRSPRRLHKATLKIPGLPKAPSRRRSQLSAAKSAGGGPGHLGGLGAEERSVGPGGSGPTARTQAVGSGGSSERPGPDGQQLPGVSRTPTLGRTSPGHVDCSAAPPPVPKDPGGIGAGLAEGGGKETPGNLVSRRYASENYKGEKRKTPEKTFRARLALAHKTFSNFFEPKILEKESPEECSPGSLKGEKEKSRLRPSSWRALLKSKDAEGPKRPPLVSLVPGPEVLCPLGSGLSETNIPGEEEIIVGEKVSQPSNARPPRKGVGAYFQESFQKSPGRPRPSALEPSSREAAAPFPPAPPAARLRKDKACPANP